MDSAGLSLALRAVSGETPSDPATFASNVLHRLGVELGVLRECLLSDDADARNAASAVFAMMQRIELSADLLEQLVEQRQKGGA